MNTWPKDFDVDRKRERITAKQAAAVLRHMLKEDGLEIKQVSSPLGVTGQEHISVDAGGYALAFFHRCGTITNLFRCRTPGGKEFHAGHDADLPVSTYLSGAEWNELAGLILNFNAPRDEREVVVVERYVVMLKRDDDMEPVGPRHNHGEGANGKKFPHELEHFPQTFTSKAAAEAAAQKLREYRIDVAAKRSKRKKK